MKLRIIPALAAIALLAGCSADDADNRGADSGESIDASSSAAAELEENRVEPVRAPDDGDAVRDPELNVDFRFQGTGYGTNGGSLIYVAVTNLNDEPLPRDAIAQPTLKLVPSSGAATEVEPLEGSDNIPLDLPLGAGATTNLQYAFNTSNGNLWSAEFQIANVIFDGNLNYR